MASCTFNNIGCFAEEDLTFEDSSDVDIVSIVSIPHCGLVGILYSDTSLKLFRAGSQLDCPQYSVCASFPSSDDEDVISTFTLLTVLPKKGIMFPNEWCSVVVGFRSGKISFYTDAFQLIHSQWIHNTPVVAIEVHEDITIKGKLVTVELEIKYKNCTVLINSRNLFTFLQQKKLDLSKQLLVKTEANSKDAMIIHKFLLKNQTTCDSSFAFRSEFGLFDRMRNASIIGGYSSRISKTASMCTRMVGCGENPSIAVFDNVESRNVSSFTEIASNFTNQVKSSLLGSIWKRAPSPESSIPVGTELDFRLSFTDASRSCMYFARAPFGNLCAIVDNLGRVIVYDYDQCLIVRMFKGYYRNAKISWYVAFETSSKKHRILKRGLFLIIYSTCRNSTNLVEIWPMVNGPRVAALNLKRHCVVIQAKNGILSVSRTIDGSLDNQFLLLQSDGKVLSLYIPFHSLLGDNDGRKEKDLCIFKEMLSKVKNPDYLIEPLDVYLKSMIKQIKTPLIYQTVLQNLMKHSVVTVDVWKSMLSDTHPYRMALLADEMQGAFSFAKSRELEELQKLTTFISSLTDLVNFYDEVYSLTRSADPYSDISYDDIMNDVKELSRLADNDLYEPLFSSTVIPKKCIRITTECIDLHQFFKYFRFFDDEKGVILRESLSDEQYLQLGKFLFEKVLKNEVKYLDIVEIAIFNHNIPEIQALRLLFAVWLSEERAYSISQDSTEMIQLYNILLMLSQNCYKSFSSKFGNWWSCIRHLLQQSQNVVSALSACVMARGVCIHFLEAKNREDSPTHEWQPLSLDVEAFTLLIARLEDCVLMVGLRALCKDSYQKPISVQTILDTGKASLSEFVSHWAISQNVRPAQLSNNSTGDSMQDTMLIGLKTKLPKSLQSDILLSQMGWLSIIRWNKNRSELLHLLDYSIECLESIASMRLKHGLTVLIWSTVFEQIVKSCYVMINSSSRSLCERECHAILFTKKIHIPSILSYALKLLMILANSDSLDEKRVFEPEVHWIDSFGNQHSVTERAQNCPESNLSLVQHHVQLVSIMLLITTVELSDVTCASLYSEISQRAFFEPLHTFPLIDNKSSSYNVRNSRLDFTRKALVAFVKYSECGNKSISYEFMHDLCGSLLESVDLVLTMHSEELFYANFDKSAHQVSGMVVNSSALGKTLLQVAGARFVRFLNQQTGTTRAKYYSLMPMPLRHWLNNLNIPSRLNLPQLSAISNLVILLHTLLSKSDSEYSLLNHLQMVISKIEE